MPRSPRIIVPGYAYHLTHRGNNKQRIFYSDEDRRKYLYWFKEASQKWGMNILSYCLMDNHVHFIATADHAYSFAKAIHSVHRLYAIYINQKRGGCGHLWDGRYYSCLLDNNHLLAALRYVERNPVRAGMVANPWDWVWSSAREHVGLQKGIISLKDAQKLVSVDNWRKYLDQEEVEGDLKEIRKQTMLLKAWGDNDFKKRIESDHGIPLLPGQKAGQVLGLANWYQVHIKN